MTKAKSKTGLCVGVAAVIVVVAIIVGVVISNKTSNNGVEGAVQTSSELSASDLTNIDVTVEYGDYDEMQSLAKDIQNGKMEGKVVEINGLVSHPGSIYSVVEESEDGTKKIGTQFVIDDAEDAEYPTDGAHVVLIGKVVQKDPMVYVIKTLKEFVRIK